LTRRYTGKKVERNAQTIETADTVRTRVQGNSKEIGISVNNALCAEIDQPINVPMSPYGETNKQNKNDNQASKNEIVNTERAKINN
jgi:hypothetical protein